MSRRYEQPGVDRQTRWKTKEGPMPLKKPWLDCTAETLRRTPATLGVYEIGDVDGTVIYIGFAGGRSRFGLRGDIGDRLAADGPNAVVAARGRSFRYEVNMMYLTRYIELLEQHHAGAGDLPPGNREPGVYVPRLGRAIGRP